MYDLEFRKYHRTTPGIRTLLLVPGVGCNQTTMQEPIFEEIFAVRQEYDD